MAKVFKLKPIKNKANGQINFSIPRKKLSPKVRDMIKSNKMPSFKFRLEGVDI